MVTNPRPIILFLDPIELAKEPYLKLSQVADIVYLTARRRKEFLVHLQNGVYGNFVGIYRHFKADRSLTVTGRFDSEVISALPSSVRYIAHNGAGYDQTKNIQVANIQSVVDAPTADTAMFLILSSLRQFQRALQAGKSGQFNAGLSLSNDPNGKIIGILGLGGIGKALASRAQAFGMTVHYHNRTRLSLGAEEALNVHYVDSMDELFETSDVISIHVPLSSKTRHLVSSRQFELMKGSAVLINTARGPIIDEMAMIHAIETGSFAGVGLDVYEDEPHIPSALLSHPGAICLPHVGTMSLETQTEMEAVCMYNLCSAVEHGTLPYVVPEQRL